MVNLRLRGPYGQATLNGVLLTFCLSSSSEIF